MAHAHAPPPALSHASEALARAGRWFLLEARDVMRSPVVTVELSCPVPEVARTLREHGVGGAAVADPRGRLVGVVSLRDLVAPDEEGAAERVRREGRDRSEDDDEPLADVWGAPCYDRREGVETAADVMSADVLTVPASTGLAEVARLMAKHRVHRVFVEDGGHVVGVVGVLEVLHALAA
jgi:CBS domain-containing protein